MSADLTRCGHCGGERPACPTERTPACGACRPLALRALRAERRATQKDGRLLISLSEAARAQMRIALLESSTHPEQGCWIYGRAHLRLEVPGLVPTTARRASFLAFRGPLPPHQHVKAICGNAYCIRPDHLRAGRARPVPRAAASPSPMTGWSLSGDRWVAPGQAAELVPDGRGWRLWIAGQRRGFVDSLAEGLARLALLAREAA